MSSQLIHRQSPNPEQSVSVWRESSTYEGLPAVVYRKVWQCSLKTSAQAWLSWAQHEHLVLTLLAGRGAQHVATVSNLLVDADRIELVTLDAGAELQRDWVDAARLPAPAAHPWFNDEDELLKLARACLLALQQIHRIGVVHGDLKADNVCLSAEGTALAGPGRLDYSSLRLIDFAFSLCRDYPLRFVLPTDPQRLDYLPDAYRQALQKAQTQNDPTPLQTHCCAEVDLYSLGVMLGKLVDPALGPQLLPDFHALIQQCLAVGGSRPHLLRRWWGRAFEEPTDRLIDQTERLLEARQCPRPDWQWSKRLPHGQVNLSASVSWGELRGTPLATPMAIPLTTPLTTPLATPLAREAQTALAAPLPELPAASPAKTRRWLAGWARARWAALCLVLSACFFGIDREYVRQGLLLNDLGYWLGLAACALGLPLFLLAGAGLRRAAPVGQALAARGLGAALLAIAGYYLVALSQALAHWYDLSWLVLGLTLAVLILFAADRPAHCY